MSHSSFSRRAGGTAIIIHEQILVTAFEIISDPQGCYIAVSGKIIHIPVVLVCIYASNWNYADFFQENDVLIAISEH